MISNFIKKNIFFIIVILISLGEGAAIAQSRIAILFSAYTENISKNFAPGVIDQITQWELFLMQEKISYDVISDDDLESGISDDFDILILPSVYSVSSDELKSMKEFLENGKSILTVGSKLSYDDNGNFVGEENINQLFDIESKEFTGEELSLFHYLNFNPVFDNNSKFDGLLQLSTKNFPLICDLPLQKGVSLGYMKIKGFEDFQTAMIYGSKGKGKFVWIGFNLDDVIGGKSDVEEFKDLLVNAINWLDRIPEVWISNYPDQEKSPTIIVIENSLQLKLEFVDKFAQEGIEPYLIFTPDQKISDKIIDKFKQEKLILDLSNIISDESLSEQKFIEELEKVNSELGFTVSIILISKAQIKNKFILNSLTELGVNIFLYPENFSALPSLINNKVVSIPYNTNYQSIYNTGGVNFIAYKSKIICDGNPDDDFLAKVLQDKSSHNWNTNLQFLKDWWIKKNNITVSLNPVEENVIILEVTNKNLQELNNINLILKSSEEFDFDLLTVSSANEAIDYSIDKAGNINLMINKIAARQTKRINVVFNRD